MARSVAEDQLQSFRFRVFEVEGGAGIFDGEAPVAGFNTITTPNLTIEVTEHRTGNQKHTKKLTSLSSTILPPPFKYHPYAHPY